MGRIERITRHIGLTADERHRNRIEIERTTRHYDRLRAEAMIQRGWI